MGCNKLFGNTYKGSKKVLLVRVAGIEEIKIKENLSLTVRIEQGRLFSAWYGTKNVGKDVKELIVQ